MQQTHTAACVLAKWLATLPLLLGCQASAAAPYQHEDPTNALGPDSSLTIVPFVMAGEPSKDVADVVGLMLEQEGMPNIVTINTPFVPDTNAGFADMADAFAKWATQQKLTTDAVLFAEIRGELGKGVDEVRAVLVDTGGHVLWKDRQTPEDANFCRVKPSNPMSCCVLLRDRLIPRFQLTSATRGRVKDGRLERLWAEKSGTPAQAEYDAMAQRVKILREKLGDGTLLVFPAQLHPAEVAAGDTTDHAATLVAELSRDLHVAAVAAESSLKLEVAPSSNEQARLWELARKFRQHVRTSKPDADYSLVAEYTIRPSTREVWTVHFVICDRAGEWVIVDFQNNHHADFNAIAPKSPDDCARLVARRLAEYLRE